jgi:hypothetical protein
VAENEYLDATQARRWQPVARSIREGDSESDIARSVVKCLCKELNTLFKELGFGKLIRLLNDPPQLRAMCEQIQGFQDVQDFLMEAADQATDLVGKISHVCNRLLDNRLFDVPTLVGCSAGSVSITEARRNVHSARSIVRPEIERIATRLSKNPDSIPRPPRRNKPGTRGDVTQKMLGESLLAGFRR